MTTNLSQLKIAQLPNCDLKNLVLQQMAGHSKLGCKPKDKAKEAAEKAKGQKSADSNSEESFFDFYLPSLLESSDF